MAGFSCRRLRRLPLSHASQRSLARPAPPDSIHKRLPEQRRVTGTTMRGSTMRMTSKLLAALALLALPCGAASAEVTLKAVMHPDVKIVDPIWTTAYITRNHGYMIYDTLFAMGEKGEIKPQMVDK